MAIRLPRFLFLFLCKMLLLVRQVSDQCRTFVDADSKRFSSDCNGSFVVRVQISTAKVQKFGTDYSSLWHRFRTLIERWSRVQRFVPDENEKRISRISSSSAVKRIPYAARFSTIFGSLLMLIMSIR